MQGREKNRSIQILALVYKILYIGTTLFSRRAGCGDSPGCMFSRTPRKILFVKLCCIGDIIFTTPALHALRGAFPSAHITYLAASWVQDILHQIDAVDEVMLFDAPLWEGRPLRKLAATVGLIRRLRAERFDLILIGHRSPLFPLIGLLASIPDRIGFGGRGNSLLTQAVTFRAEEYEARRYLDLLVPLGISGEDDRPRMTVPEALAGGVNAWLSEARVGADAMIVAIHAGGGENPGTTMTIKRWDRRRYGALCSRILSETSAILLLLGGAGDRALNEEIAGMVEDGGGRVRNAAGELPLRSLPALLRRCSLVIGGDTGPVHLAAAVGTPTLFLFGPSDPRLVSPPQRNVRYIWKQVSCSPCYTPETVIRRQHFEGRNFVCHTGTHECLETIEVKEVADLAMSMLREAVAGGDRSTPATRSS